MTSKWIQSAPAATTLRTSSPKRAKSAESRLGAIQVSGRVMANIEEDMAVKMSVVQFSPGPNPGRPVHRLKWLVPIVSTLLLASCSTVDVGESPTEPSAEVDISEQPLVVPALANMRDSRE